MEEKKKFKILCIDGGGIKGLYSAQVLAKFEESFNTRLSDHFDLRYFNWWHYCFSGICQDSDV